jgi:hypothetical protein
MKHLEKVLNQQVDEMEGGQDCENPPTDEEALKKWQLFGWGNVD